MRVKQSFVTNSSSCGHIVILRKNYDFDEIYKLAENEIAEYIDYDPESDDKYNYSPEDYKEETKDLLDYLKMYGTIKQENWRGPTGTAIDIVSMVISYGAGYHVQSFDLDPDSSMIINLDESAMEDVTKAMGEYLYESG